MDFGHVHRRAVYALVSKSELIQVEGMKKDRGKPKKNFNRSIKKDVN